MGDDFKKKAMDLLIKFCEEKDTLHAILAFNLKLNDSGVEIQKLALSNGGKDFLEAFDRVAEEVKCFLCDALEAKVEEMVERKNDI